MLVSFCYSLCSHYSSIVDAEQKVLCTIHQLLLCVASMVTALTVKYKSSWSQCERDVVKSKRMDWQGCGENCELSSFPNVLQLLFRLTFSNEHLFLLIAPLEHGLCLLKMVFDPYHSCKLFH